MPAETPLPRAPLFADSKGREVVAAGLRRRPGRRHARASRHARRSGVGAGASRARGRRLRRDRCRSQRGRAAHLRVACRLVRASARGGARRHAAARDAPEPPEVRIIVGVHPHNAKNLTPHVEVELIRLAADGADGGHRRDRAGLPLRPLSARRAARGLPAPARNSPSRSNLPAVVHLREAHDDGEAIMREVGLPVAGCILHCYNLGAGAAAAVP